MKRLLACAVAAMAFLFVPDVVLHPQQVSKTQSPGRATQPEAFVGSFYHLVVARHPVSIPDDSEMKVFAPFLSEALMNRIHLARACSVDWERQNPPPPILKPPFSWLESGLFSGANEKASPRLYHVERTQLEKNGSFSVYVRLTYGSPEKPWIWHVAAIVIMKNGRFAIDDVIYLKDEADDTEWRLSESLAEGCDGTRWVGYSDNK